LGKVRHERIGLLAVRAGRRPELGVHAHDIGGSP
jgi:hypothetical protein